MQITRRLVECVLAVALLALFASEAQAQRQCTHTSWFQHTTPTGPIEIVPGVDGQRIYPCGFMLTQKGNTLDFQMWGTPFGLCVNGSGFSNAQLFTPQLSLPTDVQLVNRLEVVGPFTPPGYSLCIQTFGAGALTGAIYWEQF